MGGRYYITGVQIGMLLAFLKLGNNSEAYKFLEKILDEQYICDAEEFKELIK